MFAALAWAFGRHDSLQVLFLSSAILVAVSSVIVFAVLGELASLQAGKPMLRYAYASFGVALPVVAVLTIAGYGVAVSVAIQAVVLLAVPVTAVGPTIDA